MGGAKAGEDNGSPQPEPASDLFGHRQRLAIGDQDVDFVQLALAVAPQQAVTHVSPDHERPTLACFGGLAGGGEDAVQPRQRRRLDPDAHGLAEKRAHSTAPIRPTSWPSRGGTIRKPRRLAAQEEATIASRIGPVSDRPEFMTLPPSTISSGLRRLISVPRPTPSARPASARRRPASGSPALAAASTSRAVGPGGGTRWSRLSLPACSASRAERAIAVPLASASRQPWLPQRHSGPPGCTTMWPTSPATPPAPL